VSNGTVALRLALHLVGLQGSLEVRQNSVPEVVLASPAVTEVP